jgi:hypothetical protein
MAHTERSAADVQIAWDMFVVALRHLTSQGELQSLLHCQSREVDIIFWNVGDFSAVALPDFAGRET